MNETLLNNLVEQVLVPLSDRTKNLLQPIHLQPNDRISLDIDRDFRHFVVSVYAVLDGRRVTASYAARQQWICRIPERKQQGLETWLLGATDFTALIIHTLWPNDKIDFLSEEAAKVYQALLLRFFSQSVAGLQKANFKINGELPPAPLDFVDHAEIPLSPYQRCALFTALGRDSALFMEQGTGKTPIIIRRICVEAERVYQNENRMYRAIIVCPKGIRLNWQKEVHRFATVPGRVVVLRGGQLDRLKLLLDALRPDPDDDSRFVIVIASYEGAKLSLPVLKSSKWQWDLGVLDESHYIKSGNADRGKAMMELRDKCKCRMVLTGTPVCNNVNDLFMQLEFLDQGLSGFSSFEHFRKFYGVYEQTGRGYEKFVKTQNLPLLQERLSRVAFMVTKKEAMPDLPDKVYDVYEVEMTAAQSRLYADVCKDLVVEIESELAKGENSTLTVQHILTKLLRLAQVTSGYVKLDSEWDDEGNPIGAGEIVFMRPNPKIDALVDILSEKAPNEKTIIWSNFVPVIQEIDRALTSRGIKHVLFYGSVSDANRDKAVESFNCDPDCKVFVGNPAAGGVGLNLWGYNPEDPSCETNCTHEIYYSQNWSYAHRAQSEDRAHRRGTRVNVRITDLVVPGSIDDEIRNRVLNKKLTALEVQDVKEIMQRVLAAAPVGDED